MTAKSACSSFRIRISIEKGTLLRSSPRRTRCARSESGWLHGHHPPLRRAFTPTIEAAGLAYPQQFCSSARSKVSQPAHQPAHARGFADVQTLPTSGLPIDPKPISPATTLQRSQRQLSPREFPWQIAGAPDQADSLPSAPGCRLPPRPWPVGAQVEVCIQLATVRANAAPEKEGRQKCHLPQAEVSRTGERRAADGSPHMGPLFGGRGIWRRFVRAAVRRLARTAASS
jgi:hypothetical protein